MGIPGKNKKRKKKRERAGRNIKNKNDWEFPQN